MNNWIKAALSLCSVLFFYNLLNANPIEKRQSIFELMGGETVVELTIDIDLDSVIAQRKRQDAIDASLSFVDAQGRQQEWRVNLTARGRFRRVHCAVPPLKIDFKKGDLDDYGLAKFDDYKLVTHCAADPDVAAELVLREYLAYRLYNELTEYSFRAQLVKLNFRNLETGKEDELWGFLIEDTAELSARLGLEKVEHMALPIDSFHRQELKLVSVFQEMIGNNDWGIQPSKNIKYFRRDGKLVPVPYDFDFSSLVDAPYAEATSLLQNKKVATALYTSLEPSMFGEDIAATVAYVQSKRKELLTVVRKNPLLPWNTRMEMVALLNDFFRNPPGADEGTGSMR
jgi:hypothetical protein